MSEVLRQYHIELSVSNIRTETEETGPILSPPIDLVIAGSLNLTPERNQEIFGERVTGIVADVANTARQDGKRLVLDAATGSSPKAVWESLAERVQSGLDLSHLIVIGHEEAWGARAGGTTDYDFQRARMLRSFGSSVKPITSEYQVNGDQIDGDLVLMYQFDSKSTLRGAYDQLATDLEAAQESSERYTNILRELMKRKDVESIGVYGIGTDGHIGEWQIHDMGFRAALGKRDAFVQPQEHYSVEAGMFPTGGKPNIYWQRGAESGEAVGRAAWQPEMSAQNVVMGLGLRDMIRLDHVVLVFNNASKSAAFQMAMGGSVDGVLSGEKMQASVRRNKGEGEGIWPDLANYGRALEILGLLRDGTVDEIETGNKSLVCGLLYQAIYKALDDIEASSDHPVYAVMGEFSRRYVGKRSPLGQIIRMRALFGKKTTIVATPEVVKDTRYEALAP